MNFNKIDIEEKAFTAAVVVITIVCVVAFAFGICSLLFEVILPIEGERMGFYTERVQVLKIEDELVTVIDKNDELWQFTVSEKYGEKVGCEVGNEILATFCYMNTPEIYDDEIANIWGVD